MDQGRRVRGIQRAADLLGDSQRVSPRQRAALADQRLQARPVHVAHRQVEDRVDLVRVVDRDHMRVVERRGELRLARETGRGSPGRRRARARSPSAPRAGRVVRAARGRPCPSRRGRGRTRSCTARTRRRRSRARAQPIAEAALVLDQMPGLVRLELLAKLPDDLRELLARVHRLVSPDGVHQLGVRAQRRRALGHVGDELVRLGADVQLVPLPAADEDETSLVRRRSSGIPLPPPAPPLHESPGSPRSSRTRARSSGPRPGGPSSRGCRRRRRSRRGKRPSTRLSSPARRTNVPLTLPPSTIDHVLPERSNAQCSARVTRCSGIGLERDVVQFRQPADRDALARQLEAARLSAPSGPRENQPLRQSEIPSIAYLTSMD